MKLKILSFLSCYVLCPSSSHHLHINAKQWQSFTVSIHLSNYKDIFSLGHSLLSKNNCTFIWPRLKRNWWPQSVDDVSSQTCCSCNPLGPSYNPPLLKSWKIFFWDKHFPLHTSNRPCSEWLTQVLLSLLVALHSIYRNVLLLCKRGRPMCGHASPLHSSRVLQEPPWHYAWCGREELRNKSECFVFGVCLGHLAKRHLLILTEAKNKVNINFRWHADELCIE